MSAPDPDSAGLVATVLAGAAAIVAPIWGARTWLEKRFAKKADKVDVDKTVGEVKDELKLHRGYFKDVFEQMRQNEQRAQDRHERLMERLSPRE